MSWVFHWSSLCGRSNTLQLFAHHCLYGLPLQGLGRKCFPVNFVNGESLYLLRLCFFNVCMSCFEVGTSQGSSRGLLSRRNLRSIYQRVQVGRETVRSPLQRSARNLRESIWLQTSQGCSDSPRTLAGYSAGLARPSEICYSLCRSSELVGGMCSFRKTLQRINSCVAAISARGFDPVTWLHWLHGLICPQRPH